MTRRLLAALLLSATSLIHPVQVLAHSCAYPDFALIDYQVTGGSDTSLHVYSYNPPYGVSDITNSVSHTPIFPMGSGYDGMHGFATDNNGVIYVGRASDATVQAWNGDPNSSTFGASLGTVATDVYATGMSMNKETGMLYMLSGRSSIKQYNTKGSWGNVAQSFASGSYAQFGIEVGPDGRIYVMTGNDSVVRYEANGTGMMTFATGTGTGNYGPRDIAFGPDGDLYATTPNGLMHFDGSTGQHIDTMFIQSNAGEWPHGLTFHPTTGQLFVANYNSVNGVHVYDSYTPGSATPRYILKHAYLKDIQFLNSPECNSGTLPTNTPAPPPATSTPTPLPLPGDIDGDGDVDYADYWQMVTSFGSHTIFGLAQLIANFGTSN